MRLSFPYAILCSGLSLLISHSYAYQLERRTVASDVCVELNVALTVPNFLFPKNPITIGDLEACLCLSAVADFVESDALALTASLLVGKDTVISIITDLINDNNPNQCQYPDHAVPFCAAGNPCSFTCSDGFTFSPPAQCLCNPPYSSCNGKCVLGPCPSAYAKRENVNTLSKRSQLCPVGFNACSVLGGSEKSWECVDTKTDLESCGGCLLSLPSASPLEPKGQDCTAIPGVSDVSCIGGTCVVHRCMPGFDISDSGSACVARDQWSKFRVAEWM